MSPTHRLPGGAAGPVAGRAHRRPDPRRHRHRRHHRQGRCRQAHQPGRRRQVIDRVDIEKIIDRVDIQKIIERVDINAIVDKHRHRRPGRADRARLDHRPLDHRRPDRDPRRHPRPGRRAGRLHLALGQPADRAAEEAASTGPRARRCWSRRSWRRHDDRARPRPRADRRPAGPLRRRGQPAGRVRGRRRRLVGRLHARRRPPQRGGEAGHRSLVHPHQPPDPRLHRRCRLGVRLLHLPVGGQRQDPRHGRLRPAGGHGARVGRSAGVRPSCAPSGWRSRCSSPWASGSWASCSSASAVGSTTSSPAPPSSTTGTPGPPGCAGSPARRAPAARAHRRRRTRRARARLGGGPGGPARPSTMPRMSFTEVSRPHPQVAVVTLNRPERMNAMAFDVMIPFRDALREIGSDNDVRVVVITGAGRGFCSGADHENPGTMPNMDGLDATHHRPALHGDARRRDHHHPAAAPAGHRRRQRGRHRRRLLPGAGGRHQDRRATRPTSGPPASTTA